MLEPKQEPKQSLIQKLFSGTGWALFTMFVWEMVEEGLENLLAYAISSVFAVFITKALSTLAIITATQGIKVAIKRFLMPFVKTLTYKKGNDKMKLLKKYFTRVWGNKITGICSAVPAGFASYLFCQSITTLFISVLVSSVIAIACFNIAIYGGGETLKEITDRFAEKNLTKEQNTKLKELEKAKTIVEQYEKAKETLAQNTTTETKSE